jgi:hypothetical protein
MLASAQDDGQRRGGLFAKTVSYANEWNLAAAQQEMDKQYKLAEAIGDALAMAGDLIAMGNIALENGDPAGAEGRFQRANEIVQASPAVAAANKENQRRFAIFTAARVALAKSEVATAKAKSGEFASAVASSGNPFQKRLAHEIAGQVALAEKRWADAVTELQQANQVDPYNIYRLSLAHAGSGDAAEARRFAEAARNDNGLTSLNHAFVRHRLAKAG